MVYKKIVPKIISKLSDGDEDTTEKSFQEKIMSRGSTGERKLTNRIGRTQNRTFDVNQKVLNRLQKKGNSLNVN